MPTLHIAKDGHCFVREGCSPISDSLFDEIGWFDDGTRPNTWQVHPYGEDWLYTNRAEIREMGREQWIEIDDELVEKLTKSGWLETIDGVRRKGNDGIRHRTSEELQERAELLRRAIDSVLLVGHKQNTARKKKPMVTCDVCGVLVRRGRIGKHKQKVHSNKKPR